MKKKISNWTNYPTKETEWVTWDGSVRNKGDKRSIARGMGRCYGDASLSDCTISMLRHNMMLRFNEVTGDLTCQSGTTLQEILDVFVPKGWFLPVTPGTKYITVGGALASDVHGKNHHLEGSFGDHVSSFSMILPDNTRVQCSPESDAELFHATRGGMGLTGIIDEVTFRLKPIETAYIRQKQVKAKNLSEILDLFDQYKEYTYSMAWIDCLKSGSGFGRSILIVGEHSKTSELASSQKNTPLTTGKKGSINMPINLPSFALNTLSIKAFNMLYYAKNTKKIMDSTVHYDGFFYPLDAITHWNRMYGKRGFIQYQFVLPLEVGKQGLTEILNRIRKKGWGSFLAVLKLFGEQDSLISFPMKGYTLALDFPIKSGLFDFLDELDEVVADFGGRIYLSKDARMKPTMFWDGYPHAKKFYEIVKKVNPDFNLHSDLFNRLDFTRTKAVDS